MSGLNNLVVEFAGREKMKLHPTIDFSDKAYFGFWVDNLLVNKKKYDNAFCIITSEREIFPVIKKEEKIKLPFNVLFVPDRLSDNPFWRREYIQDFIENNADIGDANIFELTREKLEEYIDFPNDKRNYDLFALWIIGTYFFPLFEAYPYIYFGGFKRSGKTRAMTIATLLSFNGVSCSNISMPSVYRIIEQYKCSLGIDETEFLVSKKSGEIRNILNAGYLKGSKVIRQEKSGRYKFYNKFFDNYSPKVLVNISGLEDVLADRTIEIIMEKSVGSVTRKELKIESDEWSELKNYYYLFVMKNWKFIKQIYDKIEIKENIAGRDLQLWKPIFALAKWFSLDMYDKIVSFALEKIDQKGKEEMESATELGLLEVLVLNIEETGFYKLEDMLEWMGNRFYNGNIPNWLSSRTVSKLLKKFGFVKKARDSSGLTTVEISMDRLIMLAEKFINISYLGSLIVEHSSIKSLFIGKIPSLSSVISEDTEVNEDKIQMNNNISKKTTTVRMKKPKKHKNETNEFFEVDEND